MAKKPRKEGWIIPGREKLAMVFGMGSGATLNTFVTTFLALYVLMVGISPVIAAAVLLIVRSFDAINDVIFGYIVDKYRFKEGKTRFTKWLFSGRYMPWFRVLFLIIPIGTVILFSINTDWPLWLRVTQLVIGYLIYDIGMTVTGAYLLLPLSTTNNYDERTFVLAWNGLGQGFGALPVIFLGTVFIAGGVGYTGAVIIFAILGILLALIPSFVVKERNVAAYDEATMEKYDIRGMLSALKGIPELFILLLGVLFWGIFYTTGYGLFVAFYIFNDANVAVIMTLFSVLPSIILVPFLPAIFKRVDKIIVARIACIVFAATGVIINFMGAEFLANNLSYIYLFSLLQATSFVMTMFAGSMLIPDIAEMIRFRNGKDIAGSVTAMYGFTTKLVNTLVTSVSLLLLGFYGWVAVEADSFEELAALNEQGIGLQTDRALEGLWHVAYLYPLIGFALAAVAFFFVKVKRKKVAIYMQYNSGEITKEEADAKLAEMQV
jgi:Na+/melibiose symporter-like transporter